MKAVRIYEHGGLNKLIYDYSKIVSLFEIGKIQKVMGNIYYLRINNYITYEKHISKFQKFLTKYNEENGKDYWILKHYLNHNADIGLELQHGDWEFGDDMKNYYRPNYDEYLNLYNKFYDNN